MPTRSPPARSPGPQAVRNVKPLWSRYGLTASLMLGGADMWINSLTGNRSPFGSLARQDRRRCHRPASRIFPEPIDYPKPDGTPSSTG